MTERFSIVLQVLSESNSANQMTGFDPREHPLFARKTGRLEYLSGGIHPDHGSGTPEDSIHGTGLASQSLWHQQLKPCMVRFWHITLDRTLRDGAHRPPSEVRPFRKRFSHERSRVILEEGLGIVDLAKHDRKVKCGPAKRISCINVGAVCTKRSSIEAVSDEERICAIKVVSLNFAMMIDHHNGGLIVMLQSRVFWSSLLCHSCC